MVSFNLQRGSFTIACTYPSLYEAILQIAVLKNIRTHVSFVSNLMLFKSNLNKIYMLCTSLGGRAQNIKRGIDVTEKINAVPKKV